LHYECCFQCGIPLLAHEVPRKQCAECEKNPPYFDETYCLDRYAGKLQKALHQLKYQKRLVYAHSLAVAWNQVAADKLNHSRAAYLLPVPLSEKKLCIRGFNQSWEIAKRIDIHAAIKRVPNALLRSHTTQSQVLENKTARSKAIEGVFYLAQQHQNTFKQQTVIVFDDVMTTGSTLNEIARVLKDNGASYVINWVLLRTTRPAKRRAQHV
jgi:ComF family protein